MSVNLYYLRSLSLQNPNLWEFYILDAPTNLKFLVTDISLAFEKLETETRNTGTKHYTGFTPMGDFSVTCRETTSFDIHNYLTEWKNNIY